MYRWWRTSSLTVLSLYSAFLLSGCGFFGASTSPRDDITPAQAQRVLKTAYSQVGKKYRSGGASPAKGFDCSGLIYWAYRQNGLEIPRITVDQARTGRAVARNQARPGDIVVFRTGNSPRGLHTGIYAGGDKFIHSPRRGERVREESIKIDYWRKKLVSVRRVAR